MARIDSIADQAATTIALHTKEAVISANQAVVGELETLEKIFIAKFDELIKAIQGN